MGAYQFSAADYVVFVLTLGMSCAVGVYFGCFKGRQKLATEYLFGNRNMKAIPVGLSLYSSAVTAVTIVGVPTEVYVFGGQFMMMIVGNLFAIFTICIFILPVFCGTLKIKTPYEYLELRFNRTVRRFASMVYVLQTLLFLPVVLFACCVSFSLTSGIALPLCTTIIGGLCVIYTMVGGFTTVIWTDTLQATLMVGSCICVMAIGIANAGGIQEVWSVADQGQRLNFINWDPNPTVRTTFWTALFGMGFHYMSHMGCAASSLQRYISVGSEKEARISIIIGVLGNMTMLIICGLTGLAIYATYHGCDPVKSQALASTNLLLPYFASQTVGHIPGMIGLFTAGILSAGLSTISAELNTLSGLIYHDFLQFYFKKLRSETAGANVMKLIVLIIGIYVLIAAPILQRVIYILQLTVTICGITYGGKLGIILLGSTFRKANAKGTLCGFLVAIACMSWITIGASFYDVASPFALPLSTDNCSTPFNHTNYSNTSDVSADLLITTELPLSMYKVEEPMFIYKISYLYYSLLGCAITITVGIIVSYITGPNDASKMDERLLIPFMRTKQESGVHQNVLI